MGMLEGPPEPGIQPSMVPTQVGIGLLDGQQGQPDGSVLPIKVVQVMITQPTGTTYVFFDAQSAIDTAVSLMEAGKTARSGITPVRSLRGLPPMGENGHPSGG